MEKESEKYLSFMIPYENAVHDIKLPMTAMYSYIQLLEMNSKLDDKSLEYVEAIKNNWFKAMNLINEANETVKISRGVYEPKLGNYNIFNITEDIFTQLKPFAEEKNIKYEFSSKFKRKAIALDRSMFERVMLNLITNAIKFTDEGGTVSIHMYTERSSVVIIVEDNGKGFEGGYLAERYKTTDSFTGSGIGMSIIMEFTQLLGGSIDFLQLERGSKAILKLPDRKNKDSAVYQQKENIVWDSLIHSMGLKS